MNSNKKRGDSWNLPPHFENNSGQSDLQAVSYHSASVRSNQTSILSGDVAVRYRSGDQSYIVGKVLHVGSRRLFFSRVKDSDLLRKLDAWSIAPEVVDLLEQLGVEHVEYHHASTDTLYSADIPTIRQRGILKAMHATIGRRYHLARVHWRMTQLTYPVPYVENEVEVVVKPLPRQAGLFEETMR